MIAPCKDCKDRHINCHTQCEKYLEFRKQQDAANARKQKEVESRVYDESRYRRYKKLSRRVYK